MMELGTDVMDSENKNLEAPAHHTHPPTAPQTPPKGYINF